MTLFPKTCCYHFQHDVKVVITSARHKITRKLHHIWRRTLQDTQQEAAQVQHDRSEFILLPPRPREIRKTKKMIEI